MIKPIENGFEFIHKDKVLLRHTKNNPAIFLGKDNLQITMDKGEFHFENKSEFFPIEEFTIDNSQILIGKIKLKESNEEDLLKITIENLEQPLKIKIPATKDEKIFGMGEHFTTLNLRNNIVRNWVEEHITRKQVYNKIIRRLFGLKPKKWDFDDYKTYFVNPTYVSDSNYFLNVETSGFATFNFKNEEFHEITAYNRVSSIVIGTASNLLELSSKLVRFKGITPKLPEWLYDGMILAIQGGTDKVNTKLNKMLESGALVSGVWSQDWCGELYTIFGKQVFWNWEVDNTLYPNLKNQIKVWQDKKVNFLTYINPYLNANGKMFQVAKDNDFLVKNKDGSIFLTKATTFDFGIVDLTYDKAYEWFKTIIKENYIKLGIKGWMADFGEYLPIDCVLKNGNGLELHNQWPDIWVRLNREVLEETKLLGKGIIFNRAGYNQNLKYTTLIWNGDQHVDFSDDFGLKSVIRAMLSLSLSGVGLSHSDIGGYTTLPGITRNKDLYFRWLEMNAFTPIMRFHEGNKPWKNIQFDSDDETIKLTVLFSKIHKLLKPYFLAVESEYQEQAIPMIRPIFYHYDLYTDKAFLVGEDLLVYPVTKKKAKTFEIELPKGNWINIFTGDKYQKGIHKLLCPYGKPPVFYKESSKFKKVFETITFLKEEIN